MTEVRDISSQKAVSGGFAAGHQYGLFATKAYKLGDTILSESPLIILKHSSSDKIRSQFDSSCFAAAAGKKSPNDQDEKNEDIIIPASFITNDLSPVQTKKLKALTLGAASYAVNQPNLTEETKEKLFQLFHPNSQAPNEDEKNALNMAKQALKICEQISAPETSLNRLVRDSADELIKLLLIYSCNAFEGGRIYHRLSRANHSCNPNAIVCSGDDSDVSVLKAACDIAQGEEINISYLGSYLYAGYPTRQRVLKDSKYFICQCDRCSSTSHNDLASRIPCPVCHPRQGRYLDEDVMFDDGDEGDLTVSYATPKNGTTAEERSIHCDGCKKTTSFKPDEQSMRKKKEAACVNYMNKAEEKVYDRLEGNDNVNGSNGDKSLDVEREANQQFYEMATSICGAKHWTTHFMNLSLIEESLANFHSTLMSMGQNDAEDTETMEELLTGIAEAADGIERAWMYASGLNLKTDPSQWLFDYTVGLARALVGLGDEKSQKYAAQWISKVEDYAKAFESDGMQKVVSSLKNAWKRHTSSEGEESDKKRQKVA
jgi:hypothetical protein